MVDLDALPPIAMIVVDQLLEAANAEPGILALAMGGSAVVGAMDEFSDLDLVVICRDDDHTRLLEGAKSFAAGLGPLLAAFTGEHVGEPRLLICLYGPPLLHVDLKFVPLAQIGDRVEDPVLIWERETGSLRQSLAAVAAVWPQPDLQWIEDRFWAWVHYTAGKIGRGELLEALDALALLRRLVFGPLLAVLRGHPPAGVRRLEQYAGDALPQVVETVGDYSREGIVNALEASIHLYRDLRDQADGGTITRHSDAEAAAVAYLREIAAR